MKRGIEGESGGRENWGGRREGSHERKEAVGEVRGGREGGEGEKKVRNWGTGMRRNRKKEGEKRGRDRPEPSSARRSDRCRRG